MSGTSAGARRGWKTRKGLAPPVNAGRIKNPIRIAAGKAAKRTRDQRQQTKMISNLEDRTFTRMLLRGQITGRQAEEYRKNNVAEYERRMRLIGRGRKPRRR